MPKRSRFSNVFHQSLFFVLLCSDTDRQRLELLTTDCSLDVLTPRAWMEHEPVADTQPKRSLHNFHESCGLTLLPKLLIYYTGRLRGCVFTRAFRKELSAPRWHGSLEGSPTGENMIPVGSPWSPYLGPRSAQPLAFKHGPLRTAVS